MPTEDNSAFRQTIREMGARVRRAAEERTASAIGQGLPSDRAAEEICRMAAQMYPMGDAHVGGRVLEQMYPSRQGLATRNLQIHYGAVDREAQMRECEAILNEMRSSGITIDRRAVADLEAGIARGEPLDKDPVVSCAAGPSIWEHILDE